MSDALTDPILEVESSRITACPSEEVLGFFTGWMQNVNKSAAEVCHVFVCEGVPVLTLFEVDVDIVEKIVKRGLAGKKVVYSKHTGHRIKLHLQFQFLLP